MKRALCTLALGLAAVAGGCSSPDTEARVDPSPIADEAVLKEQFQYLAPVLVRRCGSMDCHGSLYRNFRLYGFGAMRLAPGDRPDFPTSPTAAELDADYSAVLGVEPEIMGEVLRSGGAGTERLTLVRKGTNAEAHKGGQRMVPDPDADPAFKCLVTWFSRTTDVAMCRRAACGVGETNQLCVP